MKPLYNILEQWADKVKPKWHPKEGLFTGDNPHTQNYTINYVPDIFVDLIEWFRNENP